MYALDLQGLQIQEYVDPKTIPSSLHILNLRDNLLQGRSFSLAEVNAMKRGTLQLLDLSKNGLLCRSDSSDSFDCSFLVLLAV